VQRAGVIFQTPFILALALSESVAMFGFVLGWLGAPLPVAGAFFAASWVLLLARFPTRSRVFGPFEAHFRAKL
jgi:hypothetical protein